ncbi:MAG TPA: PKD domain-containing protein [Gemmatimonadales bacterium]|nr:PKD domain-containing protein [Gemmatimonadales bacterium]
MTLIGAGDIADCTNTGSQQTAAVVQDILQDVPSATVFTSGDNAYPDGSAANYQNCYHPTWGQFKAKTRPAIGNHEYNTGSANPAFDYYNGVGSTDGPAGKRGEGWYSYDKGKWHIVVLNANAAFVGIRAGSAQESWLKADLAATAQPCILAYFHHPRFYSGTTTPLPAPTASLLDFWKDLYAAGADLIVNGHAHVYERYAPQNPDGVLDMGKGIRQIIAGTGGESGGDVTVLRQNVEVVEGHTRGVLELTLDDGLYAWEFQPVAGKIFNDKGVSLCHGSPEPGGNAAPGVSFSSSCNGVTCNFTDQSVDVDGRMAEWGWSFGDGSSAVQRNPTHTFPASGTYTVKLTGADDDGVMRTVTKTVAVNALPGGGPPTNAPPSVSFSQSCSGLACTFTDGSTDSDGTVKAWNWNFGDGSSSSTKNPIRVYAQAGTYTVTLIADDDDGASGTSSAPVAVSGSAPPVALTVTTRSDATTQFMTLDWTGASGDSVDVYRNDAKLTVQFNDGHYTNSRAFTGSATYVYRVCQLRSSVCSNNATANFGTVPNKAPTASFTASCTSLTCTFTDASADADGSVKAWNWSFGDGGSATVRNPTYTYDLEDNYTVTLIVTDDKGATGTTTRSVTATPPPTNNAPVADYTVVCTDLSCQFTDKTSDTDGTVNSRTWDFGDNTATSTEANPLHVYSAGGPVTVTLTATDDDGDTGTVSRQMTVTAPGPNVDPTANFTFTCKGFSCSFTDGSSDTDGTIAGWSWDFGEPGTSSTATVKDPSHIYAGEGKYSVTLTSTDNGGGTGTVTKQVDVTPPPPNSPPVAQFTWSCTDLTCGFTDASTDDGSVAGWSWDFGDGAAATAKNPSHSYAAAGPYTVKLQVTDDAGVSSELVPHDITVTDPPPPPPNQPPVAGFTSSCTNLTCSFTDGSSDPDGSIASWSWNFGDGGSSSVTSPSHTYATAGSFSVTLDVTDNGGATSTKSGSATTTLPPNVAPAANFTSKCTGLSCSFTDGSTDSDGSVVGWSWTFGDGAISTTRSPSRTYAAAGTYSVSLTATDNRAGTNKKTASVTVAKPAGIVLTVKGSTTATQQLMTLDWTGAVGTNVSVFRNGPLLGTTPNDGHYVNSRNFVGAATYTYKVCQPPGNTVCSNQVTVTFK